MGSGRRRAACQERLVRLRLGTGRRMTVWQDEEIQAWRHKRHISAATTACLWLLRISFCLRLSADLHGTSHSIARELQRSLYEAYGCFTLMKNTLVKFAVKSFQEGMQISLKTSIVSIFETFLWLSIFKPNYHRITAIWLITNKTRLVTSCRCWWHYKQLRDSRLKAI